MLKQQAVECVKVLTDPEKGIKGWNEQTYDELRNFAIDQGLDRGIVNELVDPSAIKLLHAAMMYHKGQKAMKKTAKVDKTPKKIIKSSSTETNRKMSGKQSDAMSKLRKSGNTDDAADAFLSRWTSSD
jgi:Flp pilus assembly CpaF family ATPase